MTTREIKRVTRVDITLFLVWAVLKFTQVAPIVSALLSGGFLTTLVLWRKSGAERENIVAAASRQAIEVFEASIQQLREDVASATKEAAVLRQELSAARTQVHQLMSDNTALHTEVIALRSRVVNLDRRVSQYESRYGEL